MPAFQDGQRETELPKGAIETDVLVVGSGPAGGAAALFLAELGIPAIMITKYRYTANTPRAHITNQRTMEIMRDMGIERQVEAEATEHAQCGDTVFCTSINGEEIGRILTWGVHPARQADHTLASPSSMCDIPQTYLEPILVQNASKRGTHTRFSTEYISHKQDDKGVVATVRDRLTGEQYEIHAKYMIGADGARSIIAQELALPTIGKMDIAGSMNITFKADLAAHVSDRPSVLYWVIQPGANIGGIGAGLVRMVRPWNEWLIVWGYDISKPPPSIDDEAAIGIVRSLVGIPDLDVEITGRSLWGNNELYATHLQQGRVFCAGDAIHRHPPSNGLGSNTSIQDSYNLVWKIAQVVKGHADPSILETYSTERAPVAKQIVTRANKSSREFVHLFDALGIRPGMAPEDMAKEIEERKAPTKAGAKKRADLVTAMDLKNYEFNAHGVEMGQFYESDIVVSDGTRPKGDKDADLYYRVSTSPGARLPHAWVGSRTNKVSTLDLAKYNTYTLFTGTTGAAWAEAAKKVAAELGVPLTAVIIGPQQTAEDLYYDWARQREVDEDGALLVRPDKHIAWRSISMAKDPAAELSGALKKVLGRK
ncbi:Phenol 2-monooxygenase [Vanrija pseudolonga]|uniref:Phenol 2-monooxygenase n=1 Tax=Vanrija pseudolonga TaxID=143232 RepID=A0AAF1BMT1_9TREE|nr:Phenol 2-monooxygenase [Vanrija pseudolonga]